jgi:hypothetical protein
MGKIKIGDIEGEAEDIKNLFLDLGCDLSTYINAKPVTKQIPSYWLYILIPTFIVLNCVLYTNILNYICTKITVIFLFAILSFIVYIIHFNHNKNVITGISFFGGLILILISLNIYTPKEITKKLEEEAVSRLPNRVTPE